MFLILAGFGLLGSCAGDGGPADAGDAGVDGADGTQDDGSSIPDADLGDDYGLVLPPGNSACTEIGIFPEDLPGTVGQLARITFKPGMVRLIRDQASFTADIIDQVEWGFPPQTGSPASAGTFTREGESFQFGQEFSFDSRSLSIILSVSFASSPEIKVIELNEQNLLSGRVRISTTGAETLYFGPCTHQTFTHSIHTYTLEGGDRVAFEACAVCRQVICKNSIGGIDRAEVTLGGQTREMTSGLQLALTFGQHDWYGKALVILGEPLAGVVALVASFGAYPDLPGETVDLFDSNLQLLSSKAVTRSERRDRW